MISGSRTRLAVGAICLALGAAMSHAASGADRRSVAAPAVAASPGTEAIPQPEPARLRRLDLRAPDIARIYTVRQIEALLAQTTDPDMEEVHVRRSFRRPATPVVWNGIAAPVWAMLHPLQAWRILAPLPQEQTAGQAYQAPDATAGYLVPAALSRY